jgi:hypothetical protein
MEADEARGRDVTEATIFRADLMDLTDSVQAVRSEPQAQPSGLIDLRRRVDHFRRRVKELGGDLRKEEFVLTDVRDELENDLLRFMPDLRATLYEIRYGYDRRAEIRCQFIAQLTRPESPITKEKLVPSLLTEDAATIWVFAQIMDSNWDRGVPTSLRGELDIAAEAATWAKKSKSALAALRPAALDLVLKMEARDVEALGLVDKLVALGVGQEYRQRR